MLQLTLSLPLESAPNDLLGWPVVTPFDGSFLQIGDNMAEMVLYNGMKVPRESFRAFIYDINNEPKLVNSWDEYVEHMASGIWYTNKKTDNIPNSSELEKGLKPESGKKKGRD